MRLFITALAILLLDQFSKQWILEQSSLPWWLIDEKVGFKLAYNDGIAFSLPVDPVISMVLSGVIIACLLWWYYFRSRRNVRAQVIFGLIIGGALGNLRDRFLFGFVIDFIAVYQFPVFNIADTAVTLGFIGFLIWFQSIEKVDTTITSVRP